VAALQAQVQTGHEGEKKVAALTAKVSSRPGVQSEQLDELASHCLTIIGLFFFECPTIILICLILLP
jgi:hypothetical protein